LDVLSDKSAASVALFLDLDGTLIDIAPTPQTVIVPHGLASLLGDLTQRLGGALAIVTGRPIADVDRFLAPLVPVAAGVHGAEIRTDCCGHIQLTAAAIDPALIAAVRAFAETEPGVVVESKHASIAVHYRLAPSAEPRIEAALQRILAHGPDHLILCRGRKVFEIVPRHVSKGAALETLLKLPAFRGRHPVMIGDDISDQSAFAAATRLGGCGLKVAGEHFNRAEAFFSGPAEVRGWLATLSRALAT
jgi:trehalose 6-phosphate phosphatase